MAKPIFGPRSTAAWPIAKPAKAKLKAIRPNGRLVYDYSGVGSKDFYVSLYRTRKSIGRKGGQP